MKKILLFIDNLGSGGAQRQIVNLGILLKKKHYDVRVCVYSNAPFYQKYLSENSVPVDVIECKGIIQRIFRVRRYLKKTDADVVIAFLETPGFLANMSKMGRSNWKLITNELSAKIDTFTKKKNKIYNWFERFSDAKVCNSENAKKLWESYYPKYTEKLHVIYNPVIISDKGLDVEREKTNKRHLVIAASYQELKNPLRLIEAVNMLSNDEKQRLVINWYGRKEVTSGDFTVYEKAVRLVEKYGLEEIIHLNSETDNIYEYMKISDAVCLFSTVEGLPNAICEGMVLGKPIIMSRVSDYEILVDENGIVCDPYSINSIHDALKAIISASEEKMNLMGQRSREKAKELFANEIIIQQWIDLIQQIMEKEIKTYE